MPLLAALLGGLFSKLLDYFALYLTRKLALYAAMVTAITALTATLYGAFTALILGVMVSFPANATLINALIPHNFTACASAYASALVLKWTYDWNAGFIQKQLFI